jgi:hypothetical protein
MVQRTKKMVVVAAPRSSTMTVFLHLLLLGEEAEDSGRNSHQEEQMLGEVSQVGAMGAVAAMVVSQVHLVVVEGVAQLVQARMALY